MEVRFRKVQEFNPSECVCSGATRHASHSSRHRTRRIDFDDPAVWHPGLGVHQRSGHPV